MMLSIVLVSILDPHKAQGGNKFLHARSEGKSFAVAEWVNEDSGAARPELKRTAAMLALLRVQLPCTPTRNAGDWSRDPRFSLDRRKIFSSVRNSTESSHVQNQRRDNSSCGQRQMQDKKLVEELEEVSTKLDIAVEAGARGDWPKAESCLAEVKRVVSRVLTAVERINDIDKLSDG
jgi:hypothetical protein